MENIFLDIFNERVLKALKETFVMVSIPTIFAILLGIPLGALLFLTRPNGLKENKFIYYIVNIYINVVRSFPFLIWVIVLIPFTRKVYGTAFGVYPASFPIIFIAIALYARFVEQSFRDVNKGVLDAAISLNASTFQIVWHFLLVEARGSLVLGLTSSIISFISYSTVMGIVGGGGIGDYVMRHGYIEYNFKLIYNIVFIIIIIIFIIQSLGNYIAKLLDKKG